MHFNQQSAVDFCEPFRVRNEYFEPKYLRCMQNIVGIGCSEGIWLFLRFPQKVSVCAVIYFEFFLSDSLGTNCIIKQAIISIFAFEYWNENSYNVRESRLFCHWKRKSSKDPEVKRSMWGVAIENEKGRSWFVFQPSCWLKHCLVRLLFTIITEMVAFDFNSINVFFLTITQPWSPNFLSSKKWRAVAARSERAADWISPHCFEEWSSPSWLIMAIFFCINWAINYPALSRICAIYYLGIVVFVRNILEI